MTKLYLTLLLLLSAVATFAEGIFEHNGIYYVPLNGTEVAVAQANYSGDITIPERVTHDDNTYTVTVIGDKAFQQCSSLTSIKIQNSVVQIGEYTFDGCKSLASIELPNSVTKIGIGAFWDCTSLTDVKLSTQLTEIPFGTFENCSSLAHIVLPDSVTEIGQEAFSGCTSLVSIELPNSVTKIGIDAFFFCSSLTDAKLSPQLTEIPFGTFTECSSLAHIELPNSVTMIGQEAFYGCTSLKRITIPASVKEICTLAFADDTALKAVVLLNPEPPTVGDDIFTDCPLLNMYVPRSAVKSYKSSSEWSLYEDRYNYNVVGIDILGSDVTPVYVASDIVEEVGTTQEARQEVAFDFVEYDDVTTGQGVATLTCQGADNVVNLPAAQTGNSAQAIRGVRMASADGKDYQIVQPLGNAAQDDGYYTIHFPEGYFLLGADKTPSPSFELSFTVGVVASLTDITADCNDGEAEYFTLQGIKVAGTPATGIYIRRQGSKVSKVLIK